MDKYDMILTAERQFAREVTLGVIVSRPLSVWHYLIPGMFIIDFLRRTSAIRAYSKHFMFPRRLAIDAARDLSMDYDAASVHSRIDSEITHWLTSLNLYSEKLISTQKAAIDVLIAHYGKLLKAEGESYYELIQNAYPTRSLYENHIKQLAEAENEVDRALVEKLGESDVLKEKLQLEAQQVTLRRRKILEDIF